VKRERIEQVIKTIKDAVACDESMREPRSTTAATAEFDALPLLEELLVEIGSAPPPARVWFPGDVVPAGTWILNAHNRVVRAPIAIRVAGEPVVEAFVPSWQAAVDRARTEREESSHG
jgi:hypothetical protein